MKRILFLSVFVTIFLMTGFLHASAEMRLATTTSVENSGLLKYLLEVFEKEYDLNVHVIAVGTGNALKLAEHGDVDAVLVHAPDLEKQFVAAGNGVDRTVLMYNYFVIVGPKEDPAKIASARTAAEAFRRISATGSTFVSRGDNSGTHQKEREIWKSIDISPQGKWYIEAGQGMSATLLMASEKKAYCLVDKGTYLFAKKKVDSTLLLEKDKGLLNVYSMIMVNPAKQKHVKFKEAMRLKDWFVSKRTRQLIEGYQLNGESLFSVFPERKR